MLELYSAIWRVSGKRQVILIFLSFAVAGLAAVPLSFQKDIINGLTDRSVDRTALLWLCFGMMSVIFLSLGLKWVLGYRSSILGEDIIKLLRGRVFERSKLPDPKGGGGIQGGTLATMISAEAEELGKFSGTAFSEPVVQIGTLISVIGFIASTQPFLGAIALCMIFPQIGLVLFSQKRVNVLVANRVRILRKTTDEIIEPDQGDGPETVSDGFELIFQTRKRIFIWKLSTKFLLSAINGLGMVSILALGGAFVLLGRTDVGTVVAATMGLGRIQGPTGFLIAFYRQVSATRVKFDLIRDAAGVPTR